MKKPALLYNKIGENKVKCRLCSHNCIISEGKYGLCRVRKNEDGELYTLVYGDAVASSMDPVEKKPLYHFLPGTFSYSIATVGCNFRCGFCQNWQISQVKEAEAYEDSSRRILPVEIVKEARINNARSISYTYTEPTIFFEYAFDTAKLASEEGIKNIFVTNGYMTEEAIEMIAPYLDAANVDLKFFSDSSYKNICGAGLKPVLQSIRKMKEANIWVEVTTLIIPDVNDSVEELGLIAQFIRDVDPHMPWHISRFFPNYDYNDTEPTPVSTLKKAEEIGKKYGLKHIYLGNVDERIDTVCPACGKVLISRNIYTLQKNLIKNGKCIYCNTEIKGIWS